MEAKKHNVFATLAASAFGKESREADDFYATDPTAVRLLLEKEKFSPVIWEPACGQGHISEELKNNGYEVISTDLVDRGYGDKHGLDFLTTDWIPEGDFDIITNPPYKIATEFTLSALDKLKDGQKLAMFLKILFLEGKERRKKIFDVHPPKKIYVASGRLNCARGGDFVTYTGSAVCYAWFVWEKGYKGETTIEWIN